MPLYKAKQCDHVAPFPGLKDVLLKAKELGYSFFVSTNKPDALAQIVLEQTYGKGFFDGIYGAKEGNPVKPDPYTINLIRENHGIDASHCLYVGDSHVDVLTARNAGLPCVLVGWGYETNLAKWKDEADYFVESPEQFLALLKTLREGK